MNVCVIRKMVYMHLSTPNPHLGEVAAELWDQSWLSGYDVVYRDALTRTVMLRLTNRVVSTFILVARFPFCSTEDARRADRLAML